jgi:hypothetical protein
MKNSIILNEIFYIKYIKEMFVIFKELYFLGLLYFLHYILVYQNVEFFQKYSFI